jgi:ribosomal protein L34E
VLASKRCNKCYVEKAASEFSKGSCRLGLRYACKKCDNARHLAWEKKNPDKTRKKWIEFAYGVTTTQYEQMLQEQDNKCYICKKDETIIDKRTKKLRRLAIDHCHTTLAVRGLLCNNCNRGIGFFSDNIELLKEAIAYLEKARIMNIKGG